MPALPLPANVNRAVQLSPDPQWVSAAISRLAEARPDVIDRVESDRELREALVGVLGASRALTTLVTRHPRAIEVLADLDGSAAASVDATTPETLAASYRLGYLRVAARDLSGLDGLEQVGEQLSRLAAEALQGALLLGSEHPETLTVIGMGKVGGEELNYASDVDVVFAGAGDVRSVLSVARTCFRVDVDLRPEGKNGPLVRSIDSYRAYWQRWAEPWERQALLKARAVAGDQLLGRAWTDAAGQHVWGRDWGADELRQVRHLKARSEAALARRGAAEREIKRGPGGIRDIEFAVQVLQLVHGRRDPALRVRGTLPALGELAAAGYIDPIDASALADAYRFLRTVEHRLQLVDGGQVHTIPAPGPELDRLARVLGYRDAPEQTAVSTFSETLRRHRSVARGLHERLFFRPLLEHFAGLPVDLSERAAVERLRAFGFADAGRTQDALRELTQGLTRSSRAMQQLLPLMLGWLSEAPDPDAGLLGLRTLVAEPHRADVVVPLVRESLEAARRLCLVLGTSSLVRAGLQRHPDLLPALTDADRTVAPGPAERDTKGADTALEARARSALSWRGSVDASVDGLRRFAAGEELRVALADLLGHTDIEAVGRRLSALAQTALAEVLRVVPPPVPTAVVAMGRFGGDSLSYASDLDVLLVHDASSATDLARAEAWAEGWVRTVNGSTPAERLFRLDTDLRPEGRQGPLVRSIGGFERYWSRWAETWERQALLRARPVAGDPEVGRRWADAAAAFVWSDFTADHEREIRRMKARIERERIPIRDDPAFHLKLGRGSLSDVEWTVQLLQLRHDVREPGTLEALRALEQRQLIRASDAAALREAYRWCEHTRNRLYLVRGVPGDALPSRPDQLAVLARSLELTPSGLRETYRRLTRRAREVTERLFYESTGEADPPL